ncbi:MAG: AMIN domain-containing protein, partial [Polyangiaceae bacterium]|nr:AMIN domain-containing protein [Polyangiaceae bacterium]
MRRRTSTLAIPVLASLCLGLFATDTSAHETPNRLRNVAMKTIENVEGGVDLAIEGTANATYQVRVADAGTKLIVDLFNTNMQSVIPAITTKTGVVGGVLTQTFKDGAQETTRLEINLLKTATYRVRQEGNALHILLSPSGTAMVGGPNKSSPEQIADIQFDRLPAQPSSSGKCLGGCDRILVKTSGVPSYQLMDGVNNKLRLVLKNVAMPEALERTLDVTPFKSPIRYVSTFREKGTTNVVIEIDRVGEDKGTLSMVGDSLMWSFETP